MSNNVREKTSRWLPSFQEKPDTSIRVFCFPYAGGSAASFRSWQDALVRSIQLLPVQLPGRGERLSEPAFEHLSEMIETLGPALLPYFDKPFTFFGHSMGALIAMELTRWLRRTGNPMPAHLFISARRAPHIPDKEQPIYNLSEPEFIEKLRELNGTPQEVLDHPELMQLLIPLLRADFSVCETYQYHAEPPLNCPMSVFGGLGDVDVPREKLEPWREHTTASFSLHMFPGNHFFIHTAQRDVIRIISQKLST